MDAYLKELFPMSTVAVPASKKIFAFKSTKKHLGRKFKVISLFSGCGGLDLGVEGGFNSLGRHYEQSNLEVIWANDINETCRLTYLFNFQESEFFVGDISKLLTTKSPFPKADVVIGGFPCQDFSLAGKRGGFHVKRGRLYQSMVEVVRRTQPSVFVAENVKGLLSLMNGLAIKTIEEDFGAAGEHGYLVHKWLLNAADYGVPQVRERVFLVGIRKDLQKTISPPKPTHSQDGLNGLKPWVTLKEALGDLESDKKHSAIPNSEYSKAKLFPGTQGNSKTKPDKPGPTMRAEHHGNIEWHYSKNRRLSAREAARIQSFPDTFVFRKSTSDAYRQIGNAVPPVLGWHVAKAIEKILE